MSYREHIQAGFERWARLAFRHPWITLASVAVSAGALAAQLPHLEIDSSSDSLLLESDPVRETNDGYRARFGRDQVIFLAIESDEVFSLAFLERLRALHDDLEREVPQLSDITSMVNARHTYGTEDTLVVEDLLERWPTGRDDLLQLRDTVFANPLYRNALISEDGRFTTITLELDTYSAHGAAEAAGAFAAPGQRPFLSSAEAYAIAAVVSEVASRHRAPGFEIHVTGNPVVVATIMRLMQRDLGLFSGLSLGVIALVLAVVFRRPSGVLLPLVVIVLAMMCTVASMAAFGVAITLPIQTLPSLLLAVSVCGVVHVLTLFYRELDAGAGREDAIGRAMRQAGLPVLMTSLTTAGGLASFASAELAPVVHFGVFGPLGVLFALGFTVMLLPALLAVTPLGARRARAPRALLGDRLLLAVAAVGTRHPRRVVAATGVLLVLGALGISRLGFSHDPLRWMPETLSARRDTELVDRVFEGTLTMEMWLRGDRAGRFFDPELLRRLDGLRGWLAAVERGSMSVGKSFSIADVLKEIHRALNENRPEMYAIPDDPDLAAQEFLLFESAGSEDLEDFVDPEFSMAGFALRIPTADMLHVAPFAKEVEARFRKELPPDVEVSAAGRAIITSRTYGAVVTSMTRSYAIAFVLVTPLMILLLGSLRIGLISMVPNLVPVALTLGLMGWLGASLNFSTMMTGAILLGVVVDDTIHFMHHFQHHYARSGDPAQATRRALETTGRALLFTSIVLASGFFIYMFSAMGNLVELGLYTGLAIAMALIADVVLAPALMTLLRGQTVPAAALRDLEASASPGGPSGA